MEELLVYIQLGFKHISDVKGYDHILFIVTLCAIYRAKEWKKILVLITAFTLGHSVTLALAAFHVVVVNAYIVELLIPITILLTSIFNILYNPERSFLIFHYSMATVFGLVHGMGFSNFFNSISIDGRIIMPLLGFNIGLEIGQLLIVAAFFTIYLVIMQWKKMDHQYWKLFFSGVGMLASVFLIIERF